MDTSVPVSALDSPQPQVPQGRAIAPVWHTLLLIAFFLAFSYLGSAGHPGLNHKMRVGFYAETIVMEWLMVAYVIWGLRMTKRTTLGGLIGGRWRKPEDFLLDMAVAAGFWFVSALVLGGLGYLLGMNNIATVNEMKHRIGSLLPDGLLEIVLWIGVSITAGFCEEVLFRGYLQRQCAALANAAWFGAVAQGLIFGASHAYEGWQQMVRIAVFGIMFGMLAQWRKSLRPGMMAHFAQDAMAGLLVPYALKHLEKAMPKG
jgi:membrane protease YdiL (CAAX protease family)